MQRERQVAYQYFAEGKLKEALWLLKAIENQYGPDVQTCNDIAVVLFKLGRSDEAILSFRQAQILAGETENLLVDNLISALQESLTSTEAASTQTVDNPLASMADNRTLVQSEESPVPEQLRILLVCEYLVASGGLLRLERIAEVLQNNGHTAAYLQFASTVPAEFEPAIPALTLEQASEAKWDAVIIPGAGFSSSMIDALAHLRQPQFGVRIQLILNDQHIRNKFLAVNTCIQPHFVIFNNLHWPPGSYRDFSGSRFYHLLGGVDTIRFSPRSETSAQSESRFIVGAQAAKNPKAVLETLALLPENHTIRFFGFDRLGIVKAAAESDPRVEYVGPLFGNALVNFYRNIDVMVSVEEHAGWANVVAEAMSSGVPVVTTPAGTTGIAHHEETALVVPKPDPHLLSQAVRRISSDKNLRSHLATAGRQHILAYDWRGYTDQLIRWIRDFDGIEHYTSAPGLSFFGKATIEERLDGLEHLLQIAPECSTVLDVGAAEGVLAAFMCSHGAKQVDAYELNHGRVQLGQRSFKGIPGWSLKQADLTKQEDLNRITLSAPTDGYDLVFYLGIHQHLAPPAARHALNTVLSLSRSRLAIRTPRKVIETQSLRQFVKDRGFIIEYEATPTVPGLAGDLIVFKREAL